MKFRIAGFCIALLLLFTASAFAQWQNKYQIQQNYTFNAVHFPTNLVGYTVGSGGVIFKTIDGGVSWTQQTSPTTNALNDVFFTSATAGFAVGVSGTIISTADGTNWAVHAQSGVITTATIYGVWFVGSDGWIAGGADNVACQIYKTVDGGANWANVVVTNPSLDMCTDISFADASRGYASLDGNGCMYTTDGGVNWIKSTVSLGAYPYTRTDIEGIMAISATHAVATGWGSNVGGQPTILIVSTDGGATFNAPDPNYSWKTYTYGQNFAKFYDGEVIAVGGGSQSAAISIHSTGPSYSTWTRAAAFYGDEIADACALPGTNTVVAVGSSGLVARSIDRGATWSFNYDAGMPFQGVQDFAAAGDRIFGAGAGGTLLFWNTTTGSYAYGMCSPKNWGPTTLGDIDLVPNKKTPPPGVWDDTLYNDVLYYSASTKYLCKSYDFGATWTELAHSNALQDGYLGMHWFDSDTGFVVGHKLVGSTNRDEVIWKTTNGGWTLAEVVPPSLPGTNMQWNSIDFAPDNRQIGVVVGDDNYIRYTIDGGATWPLAAENIVTGTEDIEEVVMINSQIGWAVGDGGMLIKTVDGGANWLTQAKPWGTTALLDIDASGPNHIWVSGADQFCYYTANGGTTWTSIPVTAIAATYDVRSVYYQGPAGLLWVGCDYANVFNRGDAVAGTETPKSLPFVLNQNYPNPFNPSTTIEFVLASDDRVVLNVYDVSGKLVAKVLDKTLTAGSYNVGFRADGLATGVYFYKLSTSKGEETRKMVLVR